MNRTKDLNGLIKQNNGEPIPYIDEDFMSITVFPFENTEWGKQRVKEAFACRMACEEQRRIAICLSN